MAWGDVNLATGWWTIPATKAIALLRGAGLLTGHYWRHDFRRTIATGMTAGLPSTIVNKVMNQQEGGPSVTKIYDRYSYDKEKRHALDTWYKDDQSPRDEKLIWELEPASRLLEPTALPTVGTSDPMPVEDYDALLRDARWSAAIPFLDPDGAGPLGRLPVASPFHGAVQVDDFQLVPLLKALRMPRVSLLLADDVGLGKTVEAGLILTSYHYLRQADVLRQFLAACRTPEGSPHLPWGLLIVDECHNLMPSAFGDDSDLCRMLRLLAPQFEHRLFLSANPPKFSTRLAPQALVPSLTPQEVALSVAFDAFRKAIHKLIASKRGTRRRTVTFAVEILGKRLLSCAVAFADSWRRCKEGLAEDEVVAEADVLAARRNLEAEIDGLDDERLVVFTEYKTTLDYVVRRLTATFGDDRVLTLFGGMDDVSRGDVTEWFNNPAHPVRLLVATDAAAEGLNLQRNGRIDRHGQPRDVTIFHFVTDQDQDLAFLSHVIRTADEIREDLGSANEIFDEAAHRRHLDAGSLRDTLESAMAMRGRSRAA